VRNRQTRRAKTAAAEAGIIGRYPREAVGLFVATGAMTIIVINALFWQTGPHPAPIFATRSVTKTTSAPAKVVPAPLPAPVAMPPERPHAMTRGETAAAPSKSHADPIAQLLEPANEVRAVQRVLTAFGYGQIRPTGVMGPDTREAIRKFERSRKLPVTGDLSDALLRELTKMNGGPLQ
jgi:hypothetical protein